MIGKHKSNKQSNENPIYRSVRGHWNNLRSNRCTQEAREVPIRESKEVVGKQQRLKILSFVESFLKVIHYCTLNLVHSGFPLPYYLLNKGCKHSNGLMGNWSTWRFLWNRHVATLIEWFLLRGGCEMCDHSNLATSVCIRLAGVT